MPEQSNEDGLVPPLKVLRKRLGGVYRADGFSGPTRRYVSIVALLVGLASLPTLAAITAGSKELNGGSTGAMEVPFLPPPSGGAVIPILPAPPGAPESPPGNAGALRGQVGDRKTKPRPAPSSNSHDSGYDHSNEPSSTGIDRPGRPSSQSPPSAADHALGRPSFGSSGSGSWPSSPWDSPSWPGTPRPPRHPVPPAKPSEPFEPLDPEDAPNPSSGRPLCHERGDCGSPEPHHHRPDWSRHRHCEDSTHRAHWSHHRAGRTRVVVVHIARTGRHGQDSTIREFPTDPRLLLDALNPREFVERYAATRELHDDWSADRDSGDDRSADHQSSGSRSGDAEAGGGESGDVESESPAADRASSDVLSVARRSGGDPTADGDDAVESAGGDDPVESRPEAKPQSSEQAFRTMVSHRSTDRSEHSRRSTLTESPQNMGLTRTLERTGNSRRHSAESRWDDATAPTRGYRGSHRAERSQAERSQAESGERVARSHRAGDGQTAAQHRNSRVGRHHADRDHDHPGSW